MKISFGIIVANGEPFIKYNLESLYPHAHEILIVEGAVEKFCHAATPDGHSIDNTVEIIRNFPDPDCKIKLIQRDGFWPEKDEMANAYMAECSGDYIWQVDVDEFYKAEDIEKVREMLATDEEITQVNFRTIGFWRSFRARLMGASFIFGADEFIRIFRYRSGYRYLTHRPPTLANEDGVQFEHKRILTAKELEAIGVVQYHYSYVFSDGVQSKSHYYAQMGWGAGCEDGLDWALKSWAGMNDPLRIHLIDFPPSWIEPFDGKHPEVIMKMIRDINFHEDADVNEFLKNEWQKFAKAGREIGEQCKKSRAGIMSRIASVAMILKQLFFPASIRLINADKSIIKSAINVISEKRF